MVALRSWHWDCIWYLYMSSTAEKGGESGDFRLPSVNQQHYCSSILSGRTDNQNEWNDNQSIAPESAANYNADAVYMPSKFSRKMS